MPLTPASSFTLLLFSRSFTTSKPKTREVSWIFIQQSLRGGPCQGPARDRGRLGSIAFSPCPVARDNDGSLRAALKY